MHLKGEYYAESREPLAIFLLVLEALGFVVDDDDDDDEK